MILWADIDIKKQRDGIAELPVYYAIISEAEMPERFYLCYCNEAGTILADYYCFSIDEAKGQADFDYQIKDGEWRTVRK